MRVHRKKGAEAPFLRLHLPVGLADLVIIQNVTSEIAIGQHGIEKK
jgi:hypothetical protein